MPGVIGFSIESSESTVVSHTLKLVRVHKAEDCALCSKQVGGFFMQAYKCSCRRFTPLGDDFSM